MHFTLHLNRTENNGLCTHFSGPKTVSGGVLQLYFNGFQVSNPGPGHNQCERFLNNIDPGPCPGHSKGDDNIDKFECHIVCEIPNEVVSSPFGIPTFKFSDE